MKKTTILLLLVTISGLACIKNNNKPACSIQVCTNLFASITIHFTDNQGQAIAVSNFQAINLRTGMQTGSSAATSNLMPGYYIVADDTDLKNLSTDGDNIQVTATNPTNNQTKTVTVKVGGGCACHISKISGPDQVIFN